VDLDELPRLHRRLSFLSVGKWNLFGLREDDYLPIDAAHSLKARLSKFCFSRGIDLGPEPRIQLVTLPRVLGYQFNPVSFYFCYDATGTPRCAVAEVTNTFREVKPFLLPAMPAVTGRATFRLRTAKNFYVSPFSRPDLEFDFTLSSPDGRLGVRIDVYDGAQRVVHAALTGRRRPLSDGRLAWFAIKYPVVALAVVARIHWQAFRLWLKRIPYFAKADHAQQQRDLYRPHTSLAIRRRCAAMSPGTSTP
ncbi:MAG TPA: DUF1365 domain-containing protein, partial [Candidatus Didemnitutus sp.]|nr:DUF1365 domain-containing protein [Candidatus Didemnitutus sp.]